MTCIVGLKHKGRVYIGGDSLGTNPASLDCTVRSDPKVFRNGDFIIGFTSSFRMGQLLHQVWVPPEHPNKLGNYAFMIKLVVPSLMEAFKANEFGGDAEDGRTGGHFLVAYRHQLYQILSNFQVGIPKIGIAAAGSGDAFAMGSLMTSTGNPKTRLLKALKVAETCNAGVRGPFKIIGEK